MTQVRGWDDILQDGEKIVWQGRPKPGFAFKWFNIVTVLFGLFFSGVASIWMYATSHSGRHLWPFGLLHLSVGIIFLIGPIIGPAYRRRKTWYTLTSRRAIITYINVFREKRLKAYPLTTKTPIRMKFGRLTSISFAPKNYNIGIFFDIPTRFERLRDGDTVAKLIRDMQKDTT